MLAAVLPSSPKEKVSADEFQLLARQELAVDCNLGSSVVNCALIDGEVESDGRTGSR